MKKKILYVDMDGVMCDFFGPFKKMRSGEIPYPQSKHGFFLGLEPLPDAIESYKKLEEFYDVYILTRASIYNTNCYTEKAEWVKKHLGFDTLNKLILCPDKSLVKGDYLIDDMNTDHQSEFEGEWIHFGSEKFPDWKSVLSYLI